MLDQPASLQRDPRRRGRRHGARSGPSPPSSSRTARTTSEPAGPVHRRSRSSGIGDDRRTTLADPEFAPRLRHAGLLRGVRARPAGFGPTIEVRDPARRRRPARWPRRSSATSTSTRCSSTPSLRRSTDERRRRHQRARRSGSGRLHGRRRRWPSLVACAQAIRRRLARAPTSTSRRCGRWASTDRSCTLALDDRRSLPIIAGRGRRSPVAARRSPLSATMPIGIGSARRTRSRASTSTSSRSPSVRCSCSSCCCGVASARQRQRGSRRRWHGARCASAWSTAPRRCGRCAPSFAPPAQLGVTMALDPSQRSERGARALGAHRRGVRRRRASSRCSPSAPASTRSSRSPPRSGWNWTPRLDLADEDARGRSVDRRRGGHRPGHPARPGRGRGRAHGRGCRWRAEQGTPSLTVVERRMPAGPREVALGPEDGGPSSASGSAITIALDRPGRRGECRSVVVGEVLFPTFDDNAVQRRRRPRARHALDAVAASEGFDAVVVTFDDGVTEARGGRPGGRAVLPDSLSCTRSRRRRPTWRTSTACGSSRALLGLFLGLLGLAAVGHALATSVQRRRHDLGIVRSFGFVGRETSGDRSPRSRMTLVAGGLAARDPARHRRSGGPPGSVVADGIGVAGRRRRVAARGRSWPLVPLTLAASLLVAWYPGPRGRRAASRSTRSASSRPAARRAYPAAWSSSGTAAASSATTSRTGGPWAARASPSAAGIVGVVVVVLVQLLSGGGDGVEHRPQRRLQPDQHRRVERHRRPGRRAARAGDVRRPRRHPGVLGVRATASAATTRTPPSCCSPAP